MKPSIIMSLGTLSVSTQSTKLPHFSLSPIAVRPSPVDVSNHVAPTAFGVAPYAFEKFYFYPTFGKRSRSLTHVRRSIGCHHRAQRIRRGSFSPSLYTFYKDRNDLVDVMSASLSSDHDEGTGRDENEPSVSELVMRSLQGGASEDDGFKGSGRNDTLVSELEGNDNEVGFGNVDNKLVIKNEGNSTVEDQMVLIHTFRYPTMDSWTSNNDTIVSSTNGVDDESILVTNVPITTNNNTTKLDETYNDAMLVGVGMSQRQFAAWVKYHLDDAANNSTTNETSPYRHISNISDHIQSQSVDWVRDHEFHIVALRRFWKEGRLICQSTSLLSPQHRNKFDSAASMTEKPLENCDDEQKKKEEENEILKGDKFQDALTSYADRMVSIVEDEKSDIHHASLDDPLHSPSERVDVLRRAPKWKTSKALFGWVEQEYGLGPTRDLLAASMLTKSEEEQLQTVHNFLEWFRSKFPYYHDKCDACGASCKDDAPATTIKPMVDADTNRTEEDDDDFSFMGYIYPSRTERQGNASRTELYRCRSCDAVTRFPRYNKALWVTTTQRGRCGEYSMLFYRILRSLGYENVRWVVDWADHVWVELWIGAANDMSGSQGRWVHCDPCEAAVDQPLLYKSWGKIQTFILAFYDPFRGRGIDSGSFAGDVAFANRVGTLSCPPVEDVTGRYTSDDTDIIYERRGITNETFSKAIQQVSTRMVQMLQQLNRELSQSN